MRIHKTAVKMVIFMMVIMLSLMSGALLHAYAGSSDHSSSAALAGTSAATPAGVSSVSDKNKVHSQSQATVDVCPGDTLWELAAANLPQGESVRSYMSKIKKANGMTNSDLKAGQILILP